MHRRPPPNLTLALALVALGFVTSCGTQDTPVDPDKLCEGRPGMGARIAGMDEVIDMCASDEQTTATLGRLSETRYCAVGVYETGGTTIEIELSFLMSRDLPAPLHVTGDQSAAFLDPSGLWFQYRESKTGEYEYRSTHVTGFFELTFADTGVVVARFSDINIDLVDAENNDAGSRVITEGFLSVIPEVVPRP